MADCSHHAAGFYQHCATKYTNLHGGTYSPRTLRNTHTFLYFFQKYFFNFLGPFPGAQELLPTIFEFPYSRYIPSNFFRRFDLFSCFLLHGTSFHLLQCLVNIFFRYKVHGGPYPMLYYCRAYTQHNKLFGLRLCGGGPSRASTLLFVLRRCL